MSEQMKIAVIGTGAVGGYYGALLQKSGQDVHFLLHSDFETVRDHGLRIDSVKGDFVLPRVNAYDDPAAMPACDLVIVSLKSTANHLLKEILPLVVKENGVVLVLQNGLGPEETVAAIVGPHRVIGGLCFLCSSKIGPGHIRHLDCGLITLGEYRADGQPGGMSPRLRALSELLETSGIPTRREEDLLLARWKKLVWNVPFNGLSVVENCLTDTLVTDPRTRVLCRTIMEEVARASAACARPIAAEFVDQMMASTEKMAPYAPSMKLDFDLGRPMEVVCLYDNPLRAARDAGVRMPETEKLAARLYAL